MKIKNFLVQLFIFTPLSLVMSFASIGLIVTWTGGQLWEMDLFVALFMIVLCVGACFICSKIILRFKGKEVEETYWDSNFEYEFRHDYGNTYSWHQTRGGWTTHTLLIVWVYMLFSPILFLTQFISLIFAIVSFFTPRIASWYGAINYQTLAMPFLQSILHFLFNFVIMRKGHHLVDG
ncbi:MAG: hypothetical protein IKD28_05930 [Clostridia bacterium]|nr:hypothetical protein [Clostridia bacterium]